MAAAPELRCFDLIEPAVQALMAHDAALGAAGVARREAEARVGLASALLGALTLAAVAALAAPAPMPLAALAVLSALVGMEGVAGLLGAAEERGALREAVDRLDAVVGPVSMSSGGPALDATLGIHGVTLASGDRLAIMGPSGCGKTRTLEALIGLRAAPPGRFRIGAAALESEPTGWARALFAYAPQDARLLTGTIADNLRLGAPAASDEALWAVLAEACLDHRVRRLTQGLETWIGDGGERLSGGERRRLSLARAYLRPAPWLVLDEPTEGLDAATEAEVVVALDRRLARTGQGLLIVSHRPAPLALCAVTLSISISG
jgi:ATP-binding cassette subfamily C protein CydC